MKLIRTSGVLVEFEDKILVVVKSNSYLILVSILPTLEHIISIC